MHDRLLITADLADARSFAGGAAGRSAPYDAVAVWNLPAGTSSETVAPGGLVDAASFGNLTELRRRSLDVAGEIAARLVASGWWRVHGIDVARILRDFIVREIANHLLAILRIEAILEEHQPSEVHVPLPVKPGYYMADEMLAESVRLVAERRCIHVRQVATTARRTRGTLSGLKWRLGVGLSRNHYLRQASLGARPKRPPPGPAVSDCRGTICIGPCWGAELQSHQPISNALRERGWRLVFFEIPSYYSRPDWQPHVLPEGATPVGAWGGNQAFVRAVRASEELCDRVTDEDTVRRHQSILDALGIRLLGSSYLRSRLLRLAISEARLAAAMYVCGRTMCDAVEPDLLFSVKGEGPEVRGIMDGAQQMGVPVVFMPHGINADDPRWADLHADLALPYGDQFAEVIARRSGGKIPTTVIGTPKYDAFFREAEGEDRDRARADFGMPPRALWIGVATTDRPEQDIENTRAARSFADGHGDTGVLVKTHPRLSQPELVRRFREAAGPQGVVLSKVDTMRALWCCDAIVTGVSSAGIEALAAGRPVVYVGDPVEDIHGYAKEGVAISVPGPTGVSQALARVLGDRAALQSLADRGRQFAAHRLGPLDGRATERAVAEIEALAARSRTRTPGTGPRPQAD